MPYQSAYPPNFSSTLTYANRYDLDEIDIFLEGDSSNPMFFNIDKLPSQLSFGKHYFNISLLIPPENQDFQLRDNSRILFEFKSKNNVVLKSDIVDINQRNGVVTCFVEVLRDPLRSFEEIEDGEGTLTVVSYLTNKPHVNNFLPEKWRDAINYRCTFPIEIRKNLINADSPILVSSEHKLETTLGRFSFVKAGISVPAGSSGGFKMTKKGTPANAISSVDSGRS